MGGETMIVKQIRAIELAWEQVDEIQKYLADNFVLEYTAPLLGNRITLTLMNTRERTVLDIVGDYLRSDSVEYMESVLDELLKLLPDYCFRDISGDLASVLEREGE
jgi:hypothetical protein